MSKAILARLSTPKGKKSNGKGKKGGKQQATSPRKVANPLSFLHMERDAYAHEAPAEYVYVRFYDSDSKQLEGSLREDDTAAQELRAEFKSNACKRVGASGKTSKLRWSRDKGAWKGRRDLFPASVLEHCDNVQNMLDKGDLTIK
jgi:hypothetical protein